MYNNQRGVKTTQHNCKVKTRIEVQSDAYDKDENYSREIDNQLIKLFKDIKPEI